jgi:hypothetical protein
MRLQHRRHRAFLVALLVPSLAIPPPPAFASAEGTGDAVTAAVSDYASHFQVSAEEAQRRVRLLDEVGDLEARLESEYRDSFAGLWVEHDPDLTLFVAVTSDAAVGGIAAQAGEELASVLHFQAASFTYAELIEIQNSLDITDSVANSTLVDVKRNRVVVEVLEESIEAATEVVRALPNAAAINVEPVGSLPEPVVDIYGGASLDTFAQGLSGTAGFSVKTIPPVAPADGILTAGHLADTLQYNGVHLVFKNGSEGGNTDSQWHTTPGLVDTPKIWTGGPGGFRNIKNQVGYNNVFVGQLMCKYGRTTAWGCGTVETKTQDPDGGGPKNAVWIRLADCDGPDLAWEGDSGGPVVVGNSGAGILTNKQHGGLFCDHWKALLNSLTHALSARRVILKLAP